MTCTCTCITFSLTLPNAREPCPTNIKDLNGLPTNKELPSNHWQGYSNNRKECCNKIHGQSWKWNKNLVSIIILFDTFLVCLRKKYILQLSIFLSCQQSANFSYLGSSFSVVVNRKWRQLSFLRMPAAYRLLTYPICSCRRRSAHMSSGRLLLKNLVLRKYTVCYLKDVNNV
jgi:hypothetical protein